MKQFGYIKDEIKVEDYILGSLQIPTEILQSDGQWDKFIPEDEVQRCEQYETYNCTAFGTLNALEFLFKRLFGEEKNWSERYIGIAAGTDPETGGNSPQKVIETIRKDCGLLDDNILPMSKAKTIEEYYSPNPLPWLMKDNGRKFLKQYKIRHEWVLNDSQIYNRNKAIKTALQYSPLGVALYAWEVEGGLYVRPEGAEDCHWCVLYGYDDGKYWKCYDSYDSTIKFLDWNFGFERVKRYHIDKIVKKNWLEIIKNYLLSLFK